MALDQTMRERVKGLAIELCREMYGPKGPPWGMKFTEIEEQTAEVGDALGCALLSLGLQQQADAEGHPAGKCGGCGEPIPFNEIAGRLLQAKRGEAVWQESYGHCKRCRKAFFPSLPEFGHRS